MTIIGQNRDSITDSTGGCVYLAGREILFSRLGVRDQVLGVYPGEVGEIRAKKVFALLIERFKMGSDGYFEMPKE